MAIRELGTILSSGEITGIQIGGINTTEKVLTNQEVLNITDPLDVRISTNEASILTNTNNITLSDTDIKQIQRELNLDSSGLGKDIDTLLTSGLFEVDTNLPSGTLGTLKVKYDTELTSRVIQYYTDNDSANKFVRQHNGATFTAWSQEPSYATNTDLLLFNEVPPASTPEGSVWYSSGGLNIKGSYPDVTLQVGREIYMEVINNSGSDILNGQICKHNGVTGGVTGIALALADNFYNSQILGIATHDILDGANGILTTFGIVGDVNTTGVALGTPLYLSDTIPGAFTDVAPDLASQIGGSLTTDTLGNLSVRIDNSISLPTFFGYLDDLNTSSYTLSANTPTELVDYLTERSVVISVNSALGTINIPSDGIYRLNFVFDAIFSDEEIDMSFDLYNKTNNAVLKTFNFNSGRAASPTVVPIAKTWSVMVDIPSVMDVVMRITSTTAETIDFDNIQFSMESVHVR